MASMSKKILNDPKDVVEEMVQGIVAVHSESLVRLKGHHVLLHRNIKVVQQKQVRRPMI